MDIEALLIKLKPKLSITWDDIDIEERLRTIIEDAEIALNHKLGAKIDYSQPGQERTLFLNYCMYDWNNCLNEFDENYKKEIYQIRAKYEVKQYKQCEVIYEKK